MYKINIYYGYLNWRSECYEELIDALVAKKKWENKNFYVEGPKKIIESEKTK